MVEKIEMINFSTLEEWLDTQYQEYREYIIENNIIKKHGEKISGTGGALLVGTGVNRILKNHQDAKLADYEESGATPKQVYRMKRRQKRNRAIATIGGALIGNAKGKGIYNKINKKNN